MADALADAGTSAGIIPPAGTAVWAQLDRATAVSQRYVQKSFFKHNGNSAQVPAEIEMLRAAGREVNVQHRELERG